ncbi:hypothetical protein VC290_12805 [Xanthomonas campestris]|uniref:hypothetical protein n=1 Tax=Xanthomonas campestris TaxID=339 RepID=UPI002B233E96|nr:hypothetical protein [Xanthomonas campestris]MEA9481248.1 hypothetical protein [Xanthomonas campestris]
MSRPEPLQPAYDFSPAPEPVRLLQGSAELEWRDNRCSGTADVLLQFLPSPRVVLHAEIQSAPGAAFRFCFDESGDRSLSFNGQKVEGFRVKCQSHDDILELNWMPRFEPVALSDMHSKTSVAAIFHLFNFPDFRGGQHQKAAPAGCALLVLESEEWRISLQELPDGATREAWNRIKDEGGCFLTHVVKLERKEGRPFSGQDASEQCHLLNNFLSFIKGGKCAPVCGVGLDAASATTWKTFASPYAVKPPYSWFNPFKASQAELLFPLFAKRWQQSEEWRDCMRSSIYWYAQANTGGGSPGIDAAIILAQSALERLAHHYLVVDRKMISGKGFDDLRASDRLRMLFTVCDIPNEITDTTPDIRQANDTFRKESKWVDAPHAITDIRNSLVHPVSKKKVHGCYVDAWKLSLWYLELSMLALCGYDDTYTSRLTAKYVTESETVPWGKKA